MSTHVLQFSNCYHRGKPEKMKENSVTSILLKYFYYHVLKFTSFFSLIPFSSPLLFYAPPLCLALFTLFPLRGKKKTAWRKSATPSYSYQSFWQPRRRFHPRSRFLPPPTTACFSRTADARRRCRRTRRDEDPLRQRRRGVRCGASRVRRRCWAWPGARRRRSGWRIFGGRSTRIRSWRLRKSRRVVW